MPLDLSAYIMSSENADKMAAKRLEVKQKSDMWNAERLYDDGSMARQTCMCT